MVTWRMLHNWVDTWKDNHRNDEYFKRTTHEVLRYLEMMDVDPSLVYGIKKTNLWKVLSRLRKAVLEDNYDEAVKLLKIAKGNSCSSISIKLGMTKKIPYLVVRDNGTKIYQLNLDEDDFWRISGGMRRYYEFEVA